MTTHNFVLSRGFYASPDQPVGATDYVAVLGIFRIRIRVPLPGYASMPELWVGFTAGGPLVEKLSSMRFRNVTCLVEDAVLLGRTLRGY